MTADVPDEIELLLPWYANGTLSPDDRSRVDMALSRDAGLRAQLELIEEDMVATRRAHDAIALPRSLTADNLLIKAGVKPKTENTISLRQTLYSFWHGPARYVTAAALALLIGQSLLVGKLLVGQGEPRYDQASGQKHLDGTLALVKFAPASTMDQVVIRLSASGYQIADGPKADGFFLVRIGAANLAEDERRKRLADLQRMSDIIIMALPSQ